jgi:hypothetical protein
LVSCGQVPLEDQLQEVLDLGLALDAEADRSAAEGERDVDQPAEQGLVFL